MNFESGSILLMLINVRF